MKKFLLVFVLAAVFSCGSDGDDERFVCENKVWNMTQSGGNYFATYGPTLESSGTVSVNQATYEFYTEAGNVTDGSICWDGTKN